MTVVMQALHQKHAPAFGALMLETLVLLCRHGLPQS